MRMGDGCVAVPAAMQTLAAVTKGVRGPGNASINFLPASELGQSRERIRGEVARIVGRGGEKKGGKVVFFRAE